MSDILSDECIYNILGHLKRCWDYSYPTGTTLETAIYRGIKAFYPDTRLLGSPLTMTDVGKENHAFDIKGKNEIGHLQKLNKKSNQEINNFYTQILPSGEKIIVKVPKTIKTMARRPKVKLNNYKNDAEKTLKAQIQDYHKFAVTTTTKDGYSDIYTMICVYGQNHGFKSVFLSVEKFTVPECTSFVVGKSVERKTKQLKDSEYQAIDADGNVIFTLKQFSASSANMYKQFSTKQGILMTWNEEDEDSFVFTKQDLEQHSALKIVN